MGIGTIDNFNINSSGLSEKERVLNMPRRSIHGHSRRRRNKSPFKDAEQEGMGGYDEDINASGLDSTVNQVVDQIPIAKFFKAVGEGGSNLIVGDSTGKERQKKQKLAAALFAPHKLFAM